MILSAEFWFMLLVTFAIIATIRIVTFFMRFKKSTWETLNISQIIMGMSTDREPNNFSERVVFRSLLLACLVYSGYIYSVILDLAWRPKPEISNLTELADSNVIPMIHPLLKSLLLLSSLRYLKKLGEKSVEIVGDGLHSDCWRYMVDYQNVSCMFNVYHDYINYVAIQELNVKVLSEAAVVFTYTWITGDNSPYQDRINKIIRRASEFGFIGFLYSPKNRVNKILQPENIEKEKLLFVLLRVLTIGYFLSIIVFLLELFVAKYGPKMYAFYSRFKFANS